MKPTGIKSILVTGAGSILFTLSSAHAGQIWDGGGGNANWLTLANWDGDNLPDFANPITFQGNTRNGPFNNRPADAVVGGINFANDGSSGKTNAFTLQGISATATNSMTLGGDITTTASSSAITNVIHASLDIILNGDRTITTNTSHNLTINGGIYEDASARKLIKEGPGLLTLTSSSLTTVNNSFSGGLDINAGVVQLNKSSAAGTGAIKLGATSGSANAELRMSATGTTISNALEVRAGSSGTKTLANRSTNTVTYSGNITANDNLAVLFAGATGGASFTISGASNSIAASKTVSFDISATGTGGGVTDSALWSGDGSISYTSNSIKGFTVSGAKTYSGGATLGSMSGTGDLVVQTSSTGPANAPTAGAFGTGTLSIGATRMRAVTTADITIGNAITFTGNPTFTTAGSEKSLIFSGDASLGATRTLTVETGSTVNTAFVEFSGDISGAGSGITKEGAGTLRLSGNSSYTGATVVSAGKLVVNGNISTSISLTVEAGATLGGDGTVASVTFEGGSHFDIFNAITTVPLNSTSIAFSTTGFGIDSLVYGGSAVDWSTISDGTYTLITGTLDSTNLGNFGLANARDIGGGRSAYFQDGSLQLVVIPEPRAALLGGLGLLLFLRRRR
jgi:autotransporter-associated beta strand protein